MIKEPYFSECGHVFEKEDINTFYIRNKNVNNKI